MAKQWQRESSSAKTSGNARRHRRRHPRNVTFLASNLSKRGVAKMAEKRRRRQQCRKLINGVIINSSIASEAVKRRMAIASKRGMAKSVISTAKQAWHEEAVTSSAKMIMT